MAATLFLLFSLSIITLSLASVNIDCGTSASGVDNNNRKWVGDEDFITSGESSAISSTTVEKYLTTLRYFPSGESNCYSKIPVTKGAKVLMRTKFYHGDYDRRFSSPTFDVLFDGKHLSTAIIYSAFDIYTLEFIFSPASVETSVCFVRTSSSSNPFVSSIEVVDLASGMYSELGHGEALFYQARVAYGTRSGLDPHGRLWYSSGPSTLYTETSSRATSIDTSGASNKPPEEVLHNSWSGNGLLLWDPTLPNRGVPVYLAMYFSEPFDTLGSRSFNIFIDGKQVNKSPVVPVFGKTIQVVVRNVIASSTTELEFRSTASSFYPPLINALELYWITKETSGGGGESIIEERNSKLPIILGVVALVAFLLIAYVFIAVILANRRKARLQALAMPTSTVANMGTEASPQSGQQMGDPDSNQPANEPASMEEIDDLIGVNQSYVTQRH